MNKRNNQSGFTLVELLAVIVVLSIVVGIAIYTGINLMNNAKNKTYDVTINNIEEVASSYILENTDHLSYTSKTDDIEYLCIDVNSLVEMGYYKSDITSSQISEDRTVSLDDTVYVERNKTTKKITKTEYVIDDSELSALCNKSFETITYTITYDANGGEGAPDVQTKKYGVNVPLSSITPTKEDYAFVGWATSSTSMDAVYQAGDTYKLNENITLYAIWKNSGAIVTINKGDSVWDNSNVQVAIYKNGYQVRDTITVSSGNTATFPKLDNGTYDIYVSRGTDNLSTLVDSGIDITIPSIDGVTVNYTSVDLNYVVNGAKYYVGYNNRILTGIKIDGVNKGYCNDFGGTFLSSLSYEIYGYKLDGTVVGASVKGKLTSNPFGDLTFYTLEASASGYGTLSLSSLIVLPSAKYTTSGNVLTISDGRKITATASYVYGYTTSFSSWSPSSGTINAKTTVIAKFTSTKNKYYFDLNGLLDGTYTGYLTNNGTTYGTVDVYINGVLTCNDCTDFYQQIEYGSTYQITDIKSTSGHEYEGVSEGSLSGTVTATTGVRLKFKSTSFVTSFQCSNGTVGSAPYNFVYTGTCVHYDEGNGNWKIKFLSGGTLTVNNAANAANGIDVFLVGGGGGGADYNSDGGWGGGGGAGGRTSTFSTTLASGSSYTIEVGDGGTAGVDVGNGPANGGNGGNSCFNSTCVSGGEGGKAGFWGGAGGSGGSGGGGGTIQGGTNDMYGAGGTNGGNGTKGGGNGNYSTPGSGQGYTTREFGESTGTLYSTGGHGGVNLWTDANGASGGANTGDGGEGGAYAYRDPGSGGSGIVIIRNKR